MPTYEYACDSCGNGFEVVQKMSEAALDVCPECGKKIRRVLTGGIGISFKGSGFYVTDSGKSSSGGSNTGGPKTGEKKPAASPAQSGSAGAAKAAGSTGKSEK